MRHSFAQSGELLDEIVTRGRGEIKHMNSPKLTSSTGTPATDLKGLHSPRLSDKGCSPRLNELRRMPSPRTGGRSPYSPRTGEVRSSKLGEGSSSSPSK